ncbi:MAG: hypothetical protein HPY71_11545 [Firmicutes bacterium]|nr:hypothetical protein [Bacillota bacterium]
MLRSENKIAYQLSLVDQWLPKSYFSLPEELRKVDELLSDERFIEPLKKHFSTTCGRPGTPVVVYLRMMYLMNSFERKLPIASPGAGFAISSSKMMYPTPPWPNSLKSSYRANLRDESVS